MKDIDLAKGLLHEGFSLAIVKNGVCLFSQTGNWIHPIVAAFELHQEEMAGASIADRVIGKAAAVLCVLGKVSEVYTPLISEPAAEVFHRAGIRFDFDLCVKGIFNPKGTGLCLAEKTLLTIDDPHAAFLELWSLMGKSLPTDYLEKGGNG